MLKIRHWIQDMPKHAQEFVEVDRIVLEPIFCIVLPELQLLCLATLNFAFFWHLLQTSVFLQLRELSGVRAVWLHMNFIHLLISQSTFPLLWLCCHGSEQDGGAGGQIRERCHGRAAGI